MRHGESSKAHQRRTSSRRPASLCPRAVRRHSHLRQARPDLAGVPRTLPARTRASACWRYATWPCTYPLRRGAWAGPGTGSGRSGRGELRPARRRDPGLLGESGCGKTTTGKALLRAARRAAHRRQCPPGGASCSLPMDAPCNGCAGRSRSSSRIPSPPWIRACASLPPWSRGCWPCARN